MSPLETLAASYIDGSFAIPSGDRLTLVNPADGRTFHEVAVAGQDDVAAAVLGSARAQTDWMRLSPAERGERLRRWGDAIADHADELARLDTRSMGRALRDSAPEAVAITRLPRYWAGMADKLLGQQIPIADGYLSYTVREPLGVIGIILPWNGPVAAFVEKACVALACGNGVVVKPSEYSPLSALRLAELAVQSGMPDGLVNVVVGGGAVGAMLAEHPGVGGVTFTGSVATGRRVATAAAQRFAKATLELGGKSPNIVFADADIDAALRGTTWGVLYNSGQVCCAGTRLLVHESIRDVFVSRLGELMSQVRVGDPMDTRNHIGPVVSASQFERIGGMLERAQAAGATVTTLASAHAERSPDGFFCDPTLVQDVSPTSEIAQQEVFGPVLTVLPFSTEEEALELANSVEYGLAAKVWTRDIGTMLRLANGLEAGSIWGNTAQIGSPAVPFGGFKDSGVGSSSGQIGIDGVTRTKAISIRYGESAKAPGWDDLTP